MPLEQFKTLGKAGEHAERQHIDFQDHQPVEIVLVPFDHVAAGHRRLHDRHHFIETVAGNHETADMLGQMPRKPHQLFRMGEHLLRDAIARIEAGGLCVALRCPLLQTSPRPVLDKAACTSSDRPKALATSRPAMRVR